MKTIKLSHQNPEEFCLDNFSPHRRIPGGRLFATLASVLVSFATWHAAAQVNTGSDGRDGVFNPAVSTNIDMADHPNGIYQFTSVNIPSGVAVTFTPNANNTPVTWLVQGNCVINGTVDVSGNGYLNGQGGVGGPGGWRGGDGGQQATGGLGPGGGGVGPRTPGSYGVIPIEGNYNYANQFLIPLLGGSGGGGGGSDGYGYWGGGGGSGSILIAVGNTLTLNGNVAANGGGGYWSPVYSTFSGSGSGGGIRLVASRIAGNGGISGARVRFDTYDSAFGGGISGAFTQGFQPIIIPAPGQGARLFVASIGGVPVSASPTGVLSVPDAVISGQQANPIPIVVQCFNLPLNTSITVSVKPVTGDPVSVVGHNTTGNQASSTATVSLNMPRGGGLIYATAATSP